MYVAETTNGPCTVIPGAIVWKCYSRPILGDRALAARPKRGDSGQDWVPLVAREDIVDENVRCEQISL